MRKKIIRYSGDTLIVDKDKVRKYRKLKLQIAKLTQELDPLEDQIKEDLKEYFNSTAKNKAKFSGIIATYKAPSVRTVIDSTRLKEENILLWSRYSTQQKVSASLTLKLDM